MILVGLLSPSTHHLHRGLGGREKKGKERGERRGKGREGQRVREEEGGE